MPSIKFITFKHCVLLIIFIFLNKEIISPCFCYVKKGLIYIATIALFRRQPAFYLEYTKVNTYFLCDIYLVFINKYIFISAYSPHSPFQLLSGNT